MFTLLRCSADPAFAVPRRASPVGLGLLVDHPPGKKADRKELVTR
jgi:hypothetical protein